MRTALSNRLVVAVAAVAVTLSAALGALVVLPVNRLVDADHVRAVERAAAIAATGGAGPGVTVLDTPRTVLPGVPSSTDWAGRANPAYRRSGRRGRVAFAVRGRADGRLVVAVDDRGGAIERRERVGLAASLVLVLAGTMGWALWAGGAYVRRLGRIARTARRLADGDLDARASVGGRDELAGLGRDIDRMAGRLGELERARAEFVAKVSHDLRTPLTVIKGFAYTLERRSTVPDDQRRLAAIGRETDRLAALVDDLLTLSQAGAGALRVAFGPVAVDDLVAEVVDRVAPLAAEHGLAVEAIADDGLVIEGDRRRLVQVLTNLATNAIRHSPARGLVLISARETRRGVELAVADDGPGIPRAEVDRILRAFEQGQGATAGSGLGLAIVTELVTAHGGRLELVDRPQGGTVARVTLPVGASHGARAVRA
jgi:two-component system sensor histidine kinase BaeS